MKSIILTEIVLKVVEFLKDDITTLYSCILVNREWCKIAIPILWSDTFKKYKSLSFNNGQSIEGKKIISIYVNSLSEESIISLNKYGIKSLITQKTLFNYSKFLRHLDTYYLKVFIRSWFQFTTKETKRYYTHDQIQVMSITLLNNFLQQTPSLISLKITNSDTTEAIIKSLQNNLQSRNCLSNLKSLKQYYNTHPATSSLFSQLSKYAWNIEHIDISIHTKISELSTLIFVQKNLKELTIRNKGTILSSTEPWINGITGPAILHQANLITHLKLETVNFPLQVLYKFENLIELELKLCGNNGYNQEDLFNFKKVYLKSLEIFLFESKYPIYLESFVDLINSSGKNLKVFTLHGCQIEDPENAQKLIISLTNFSKNLIHYDGPILEDNTFELEMMLNKCSKLLSLLLHPSISICYSPITPSINFDPLLNVITHNKSQKLECLTIIHSWKISEEPLLDFFKTHEKKNVGPIKFNYEKSCSVFHGINTICRKYNDLGVGLDCKIIYYPRHLL